MTALTTPAGAASDQTRRCPGCSTRIPSRTNWCGDCANRLPFDLTRAVNVAWRRNENAYHQAVHEARRWLAHNPAEPSDAELQEAHDIIAGTGRHTGHERTQGGDWVSCSCGAVTRGRLS